MGIQFLNPAFQVLFSAHNVRTLELVLQLFQFPFQLPVFLLQGGHLLQIALNQLFLFLNLRPAGSLLLQMLLQLGTDDDEFLLLVFLLFPLIALADGSDFLQAPNPLLNLLGVLLQTLVLADVALHLLHIDVIFHIADGLGDEFFNIRNGRKWHRLAEQCPVFALDLPEFSQSDLLVALIGLIKLVKPLFPPQSLGKKGFQP